MISSSHTSLELKIQLTVYHEDPTMPLMRNCPSARSFHPPPLSPLSNSPTSPVPPSSQLLECTPILRSVTLAFVSESSTHTNPILLRSNIGMTSNPLGHGMTTVCFYMTTWYTFLKRFVLK